MSHYAKYFLKATAATLLAWPVLHFALPLFGVTSENIYWPITLSLWGLLIPPLYLNAKRRDYKALMATLSVCMVVAVGFLLHWKGVEFAGYNVWIAAIIYFVLAFFCTLLEQTKTAIIAFAICVYCIGVGALVGAHVNTQDHLLVLIIRNTLYAMMLVPLAVGNKSAPQPEESQEQSYTYKDAA